MLCDPELFRIERPLFFQDGYGSQVVFFPTDQNLDGNRRVPRMVAITAG